MRTGSSTYYAETFTPDELRVLGKFFTNSDKPVFGLVNLPEVVKGALFARYSRSPKSIRRLFLDEFYHEPKIGIETLANLPNESSDIGLNKAQALYDKIFTQYGDDSVAQLGSAHLACEQVSNILTKILERGRLAAYLEQSTRYVRYDVKLGDRFRYFTPEEVAQSSLSTEYHSVMHDLFGTYSRVLSEILSWLHESQRKPPKTSKGVWKATVRAKACDIARGLLPGATLSNLGIYASGQSYELMLLRMLAHPLEESRSYAQMMLQELRKMIPSFLTRIDQENRGLAWTEYLRGTAETMRVVANELAPKPESRPSVTLVEWDNNGEDKVVAAALYEFSDLPDDQLLALVDLMSEEDKLRILQAYFGKRGNRRHKPGRALERVYYRFDIVCDYGGFRDLQRHRMLTVEWQELTTINGYTTPPELCYRPGLEHEWHRAISRAGAFHQRALQELGCTVAQYVVPFANRIRFSFQMNAREAFHLLELRSQREGHPEYRRIAQEMHRLIRDQAGHRTIASAMQFVDHEQYEFERLDGERRAELRRRAANAGSAS